MLPKPNPAQVGTMNVLSPQACVTALNKSMILGRKALQTELAVCLAIFAGGGSASREMKAMVTDLYCKAGYEAQNPRSRHYKTVNRKVSASASLFNHIGASSILYWIGDCKEEEVIDRVIQGLEAYEFESMDDVLEFTGRPSNRTYAGGKLKEKVVDQFMRLNVGNLHLELPKSTASKDLVKLAQRLLRVARIKEQAELSTPMGLVSSVEKPIPMRNLH